MSGHNKWSTIKHKKGKADAARGKLFTKLIKELTIAARIGGGDAGGNPRLRSAIDAARAANMPSDNIARAIKKGTGELEGVSYEEVSYEGFGPGGVAVLVDCLTDNKNRSVSEIRHIFSKNAGNLATTGAVSRLFEMRGRVLLGPGELDEERIIEMVVESGADDYELVDDEVGIFCQPSALYPVRDALAKIDGVEIRNASVVRIPMTTVRLEGKQAEQMVRLMEALEDSDDVKNVWANFDIDESVLEALS
jgi:YebC/PmpR family DNA-binding regulatory protein